MTPDEKGPLRMKVITREEHIEEIRKFFLRDDISEMERLAVRWQFRNVYDTLSTWEHAFVSLCARSDDENMKKLREAWPNSWADAIYCWKNVEGFAEGIREKGLDV